MQAQGEEGDMGSPISQYARGTIGRRDKSVNGTTEERYPRDDLNVRHTAPEAVALSGLSYGGTDDSYMCTITILNRISNSFVTSNCNFGLQEVRGCQTPPTLVKVVIP